MTAHILLCQYRTEHIEKALIAEYSDFRKRAVGGSMSAHANAFVRDTETAEHLSAEILDHLSLPIVLVESDGSVVYTNLAAQSVLQGHNLLKAVDSMLRARHEPDGEQLKSAISATCTNGAGRVVVLGKEGSLQPLVLLLLPFHGGRRSETGRALVLLRSGSGLSESLVNALRRLFRLSPAEASIAVALSTGLDLNDLARQRHVKLNTLRSQVASIMAKTGTRRQAQLVALVSRIDSVL